MNNLFNPAKKVVMTLTSLDGDVFSLIDAFVRDAKRQGWTQEEVDKVIAACKTDSYDTLLRVLIEHTIEIEDDPRTHAIRYMEWQRRMYGYCV